jgi:uncharacterized protein with HEPN domain
MDNNIKTWLYDILSSINEIESYLLINQKSSKPMKMMWGQKRAIERNIEIIGEAMNRILKMIAKSLFRTQKNSWC